MIKQGDYIKVQDGAKPLTATISTEDIAGKVAIIEEDRTLIKLDTQSIMNLSEDVEEYLIIDNDDIPYLWFSVKDCTLSKRRDTDKEYELAMENLWGDDEMHDSLQDDLDSMRFTLSLALPILAFQQSPFFDKLTLSEKKLHVKIIDIFTSTLFEIQAKLNLNPVVNEAALDPIYSPENIEVLMTKIMGQEVAYSIDFFNSFVRVSSIL